MPHVPHAQVLGVVDQLAPGGLLHTEIHLLTGELQQGVDEGGRDVHSHDALLVGVLANDGVTYQSLFDIVGSAQRN